MSQQLDTTGLAGAVFRPGDDGYAEASGTFASPGKPAVIVRPGDAGEVASAIRYATTEGLALSVRSGGHSPLGHGTNTGGMVVDLGRLDTVEVLGERRVRVGAGATWGQVASALAPHGLGLTAGDTAGVGVGGLTLGGGIGWLVRRHGLAIDNLVAARVVTADGRELFASEAEHPDLFWALRGGGGNFGVVVSFDFVAHPVTTVHFGTITYRLDDVAGLLRGWREHMRSAPDTLTTTLVLMPPLFGAPAAGLVLCCYAGDNAGAAAALDPLADLAPVLERRISVKPYADILEDAKHPPGIRVVARNVLVPQLDDDVLAAIAAAFDEVTATVLSVRSLGGAVARVPSDATAFAHRDAEAMIVSGTFVPEDATEDAVAEALQPWRAVAAHGTGAYVNFQGSATGEDLAAAYPLVTYARLAAVKQRYDPGNAFDRNHNIHPAGRTA